VPDKMSEDVPYEIDEQIWKKWRAMREKYKRTGEAQSWHKEMEIHFEPKTKEETENG